MIIPPRPKKEEKEALQKWHDDIQRAQRWPEYSGWQTKPTKPKGIPALFGGKEK